MKARMRAAVAVLILALLGAIVPNVSAHAAVPAAHRTPHAVAHARLVGSVGTVAQTWHTSYVSTAWTASPLEFAHYHVMIVARETPYAYEYTYTGQSWANVWFSHFPPDSASHAGYAIYVYGSDYFGNSGPVRLGRLDLVESSQNVTVTSDDGWKLKIPSLVKRCTAYGLGAAGGAIVIGGVVSAFSSVVPPAELVTVPGTLVAATAAGLGTTWGCFAVHALGQDKASKVRARAKHTRRAT